MAEVRLKCGSGKKLRIVVFERNLVPELRGMHEHVGVRILLDGDGPVDMPRRMNAIHDDLN